MTLAVASGVKIEDSVSLNLAIQKVFTKTENITTYADMVSKLENRYTTVIRKIQEATEHLDQEKHKIISLKETLSKYEDIAKVTELIKSWDTSKLTDQQTRELDTHLLKIKEKYNIRVGIATLRDVLLSKNILKD
jgi:chromosome segregation ATPase